MSDFFSALARRALVPAAVRPRVGSRFESGQSLQWGEQQKFVAASAPEAPPVDDSQRFTVRSSPAAPDAAITPTLTRETGEARRNVPVAPLAASVVHATDPRSARLAEVQPLAVPAARHRTEAAAANVDSDGSASSRTPQAKPLRVPLAFPHTPTLPPQAPLATTQQTAPQATERSGPERNAQQSVRALATSGVIERLTAEPHPPHTPRAAAAPGASITPPRSPAPAAPRVEIHIGRIEVMPAAATPAEPQRRATARTAPATSLDTYLAARSARQRP
jgi:hypothetical protein